MKIKISVIIPIYNMEKYLQECLDTVKNQTLREIEIICVNDGSQDSSEEIIRNNMEQDFRVKLISQENKGVAHARNAAIESALGEFVIFMDPDDWYPEDDILEHLYKNAKEQDVLICGGSFSELSENGLVTEFSGVRKKYAFEKDGIVYYRDYQFDYGYHRFIYNTDFLRENDIYFPPYIRYQDPPFFVKAMILAEKFYAMKKITYCYRVGHQNIHWSEKRLMDLLRGLRDNIRMSGEEGLEELHKITIERLGKNYLNMYAGALEEASSEFICLLVEVESFIDKELIASDEIAMRYVNVSADIIHQALLLSKQKREAEVQKLQEQMRDVEEKYNHILKSKSFRFGRLITYVPRKLRDFMKKIRAGS